MSEFRRLVIEYLEEEDRREIEEGKLGKFLGTMATAAAIGLGGASGYNNDALAGTYQPDHQEQVLRTSLDRPVPEWIEDAGKLSVEDGKMFFTNEIVRGPDANNTSMLTRIASTGAGVKLFQTLSKAVNENLGGMNKIGDKFTISTMIPKKNFWLLLDGEDGKEYHAYSQIQVDQSQVFNSLVNAVKKANPKADNAKVQQIVKSAMNSVMAK